MVQSVTECIEYVLIFRYVVVTVARCAADFSPHRFYDSEQFGTFITAATLTTYLHLAGHASQVTERVHL